MLITKNNLSTWSLNVVRTLASKQCGTIKKPLTYFQRCMKTCREYWYVALPVHLTTSACWFTGCYYVTEQGFNILKILKKLQVRQDVIDFFVHSDMGHLTVTFALYKLLGPLRIGTTIFVSSIAIKRLSKAGIIRPARNPFRRKKKEKPP